MPWGGFPIDSDQRIEPIVTRDAYMARCRQLGIQDEQMPIAEMLYEDYLSGLTALQETSIRRAKAAGADELDAAFKVSLRFVPTNCASGASQ